MRIFVVDSETTGLPIGDFKPQMIEFAGVLYHVETKSEVAMTQCLLYAADNPAAHINGISNAQLEAVSPFADPANETIQKVMRKATQLLWNEADYILAHNASFDRQFVDPVFNAKATKPWRCSKNDLKFPKTSTSRRLAHIAVDHGVYPFAAHRALNDCLTLTALLKELDPADLMAQLTADPGEGAVRYDALGLPFEKKEAAKNLGFRWDADKKVWWKNLKAFEVAGLPFSVQKA